MSAEVEVNGQAYLITKLSARQQLQIVKRLAPVLQGLLPLWAMVQQQETGQMAPSELAFHAAVALSNTISSLSDQDTDFVLDMCLGAVRYKGPGGTWAPLRAGNNGSGQVMLDAADDLATQMRLLWEVLYDNMRNFSLDTLLPTSILQSMGMNSTTESLLSN